MPRLLVVTAVDAEAAAFGNADSVDVLVGGVGPAAAAAASSAALARQSYDLVISVGIAGGFGIPLGSVVVADEIVFADFGAETDEGFAPMSQLGFGEERYAVDRRLAGLLAAATGARLGSVLTVSSVTGTAQSASALRARHPDAAAEAMEGAGVAAAAALHRVPVAEVRTISNAVGPRDREAWRIPEALTALNACAPGVLRAAQEWLS